MLMKLLAFAALTEGTHVDVAFTELIWLTLCYTIVSVALAAVTSLAVVGFENVSFVGVVGGTGPLGTTYILEATELIGTVAEPFTSSSSGSCYTTENSDTF